VEHSAGDVLIGQPTNGRGFRLSATTTTSKPDFL
jgi:hypothetical protein